MSARAVYEVPTVPEGPLPPIPTGPPSIGVPPPQPTGGDILPLTGWDAWPLLLAALVAGATGWALRRKANA